MDYNEITPQEFIKDLYYIKTKEGSLVKFELIFCYNSNAVIKS